VPNPSVTVETDVDGLWLHAFLTHSIVGLATAWIAGSTPTVTADRESERFRIVGRSEDISQSSGIVKKDEGTLEGTVLDRYGKTGIEWLNRLDALVRDQELYRRISLTTPRYQYQNVELGSLTVSPTVAGGVAFEVSLPFRALG
jgi:hypothetical protein